MMRSTKIITASQARCVNQYKKAVFKLTKYKKVVFDDVIFHFILILYLNTT